MAACGSDETAGNPEVVNPPPAVAEQPGLGEQGQGGAAQESLEGRIGQQVQLTGEIATIIAPHALTLGGDDIGENPILVVGANIPPVSHRTKPSGSAAPSRSFKCPGGSRISTWT